MLTGRKQGPPPYLEADQVASEYRRLKRNINLHKVMVNSSDTSCTVDVLHNNIGVGRSGVRRG